MFFADAFMCCFYDFDCIFKIYLFNSYLNYGFLFNYIFYVKLIELFY